MFTTITLALFLILGLGLLVFGPKVVVDERRTLSGEVVRKTASTKPLGIIPLAIALLIALFSMTTIVQAKQVGVVTTFGKPSETTLDSGLHLKAPWQKVTEIDATTQTDEYRGEDAITAILADKNTARVSATIRWAVNKENANEVYADFRSDDPTKNLRKAVVSTQFKAAVNSVFGGYDAASEEPADTDALAAQVKEVMLTRTKGLVDIKDITISFIEPDKKAQAKIDALLAQKGKTKIANEQIETARKEAQANKILSDSISRDPNVLVSKCLDIVAEGEANLPAGFQCWNGSGSAVVIPGGK